MSLPRKPLTLTTALLALLPMTLGAGSPGNPTSNSPLLVLAAFEQAWSAGRADAIEELLAADEIALSLSEAGPQGRAYTRTQAVYLIRDALAYCITESFTFIQFHWNEEGVGAPYGIARWTFKRTEAEPVKELLLRVTLRDDGGWVVCEVRALREP